MGCGCGGAAKELKKQAIYVVTLPNGSTKEVEGDTAAKIEVTKAGGGTFRLKR